MRGNAAVQGVPILLGSKLNAAPNAVAKVAVLGTPGISRVLVSGEYSYQSTSGTPSGSLRIKYASVIVKEWDISRDGHWTFDYSRMGPVGGLPAPIGQELTVELTAGGTNTTGKVSIVIR